MSLSIVIIAKNVSHEIVPALKTSYFADEIVLVDTGSTDNTIELARPYVSKIVITSGLDFAKWRNLGAKEASSEWILYLDTDERIPPKTAREIIHTIKHPSHQAYTIPRYEVFMGKHLDHWGDSRVLRLIQKRSLKKWTGKVHEQPTIDGSIGDLRNPLVHLSHKNIDEKVLNTLSWSKIESKLLFEAKHPPMVGWRFFSVIIREFWLRFVRKGLWRDGTEGIIEVIYQMFSQFITYVRLWELQRQPSLEQTYKDIDQKVLEEIKNS